MGNIEINKFGIKMDKQKATMGKIVPSSPTEELFINTKKLDKLQRAEQLIRIIASFAEKGKYDTCEKANKLIDECYKYAYSLYVEE